MAINFTPYAQINSLEIKEIFNTNHLHHSAHIYLFFEDIIENNKKLFFIQGHNKEHNNIDSFGGFRDDKDKSLLETILREFSEETLDCICDGNILTKFIFEKSIIITRQPIGQINNNQIRYIIFCNITDLGIKYENIHNIFESFIKKSQNINLTESQKENDYLVCIDIDDIMKSLDDYSEFPKNKKVIVYFNGKQEEIRNGNLRSWQWFIKSYKLGELKHIFN